jgi:iron(III) transport system substrate-binding protein
MEDSMNKILMLLMTFILVAGVVSGCTAVATETNVGQVEDEIVNIYTDRHYDSDDALYASFTQETGIKVNVVKGNSDELIERLKNEGEDTEADLIVLADVGRLQRAKDLGLLQSADSSIINENVPEDFRDVENHWVALTKRARVLVYSKDRVDPAELSSYQALTNDQWSGRILTRTSDNIYNQSLVSSFVELYGQEATEEWIRGIVANFAREPKGNDRDQAKAIAAGEGDVAIMNTYYLGLMLNSSDSEEVKVAESVGVFFPNQDVDGTHVNVSGAGVVKFADRADNAVKMIEFLTSETAQKSYSDANYEYPVNPKVEPSELLKTWGDFKSQPIKMSDIGKNIEEILKIMIQNGWK